MTSSRTTGRYVARSSAASSLEQLGEGVEDLPDGEVAVAGPDQGGLDGVDLAGAPQPAAAGGARSPRGPRRRGRRTSPGAGRRGRPAGAPRRSVVVEAAQGVRRARRRAPTSRPDRLLDVVGPAPPGAATGSAASVRRRLIQPKPTPSAPCSVEPGQPGVVAAVVVLGPDASGRGVQAGVLEPELDVGRQVDAPRAGPPRRRSPRSSPRAARPTGWSRWIIQLASTCAVPPGARWRGSAADDVLDHPVAGQAGVAVDELLARGRGDHEGRVGRDEVELLARHRLEEAALAHVDAADDRSASALNRVSRRARWLTSVATTSLGVGGQVQRLDAAAGAEVERAVDRLAHGQLGQRGRGRADPEHVVGATRRAARPAPG